LSLSWKSTTVGLVVSQWELFRTRWHTVKVDLGGFLFPNHGDFFGGSGQGPESSCQISVCYYFFLGKSYFSQSIVFGPIFFFVRPILCHQMLSAVVWSLSTVPLSRTAKSSFPFGGWYRGQEVSMWSAVCFSATQLQFAKGTKLHLCMVEWNSPTPVRRRFSLTQKGLDRVILHKL